MEIRSFPCLATEHWEAAVMVREGTHQIQTTLPYGLGGEDPNIVFFCTGAEALKFIFFLLCFNFQFDLNVGG